MAGWSREASRGDVRQWRKRLRAERSGADEARDRRACRSTSRWRECGWRFMQRTSPVEVESEAGVARQRAVRPRAWFRHRLDTSIASESGRWTMLQLKMSFSLSRQVVESTAATAWRGCGWRGSRSYGCG